MSKVLESPYVPPAAQLRVSLVLHTDTGRVAFGHRAVTVRLWPAEHVEKGVEVQDVAAAVTFDLSAAIALRGATPSALSLLLQLTSNSDMAKQENAHPATLRGELLLIDRVLGDKPVPNGRVSVPMRFASADASPVPPKPQGKTPLSREHLLDEDSSEEITSGEERVASTRAPRASGKARGKVPNSSRQPDATIVLDVRGAIEHAKQALASPERPKVFITCSYTSKENPVWNGLVRHDFICPWCHRNCYRFRTLLNHFQVEHDDMGFALEGLPGPGSGPSNAHVQGVPFTLKFEVSATGSRSEERVRRESQKRNDGKDGERGLSHPMSNEDFEDVYVNPYKYPFFGTSTLEEKNESGTDIARNGMARVSLADTEGKSQSDAESVETDVEGDDPTRDVPDILKEELWNRCKNCQRGQPRSNYFANDRQSFCSEFCEIIFAKKMEDERGTPPAERGPMLGLSSLPRKPPFNYQEKLGHLQLYHVVSVCEAKEEHYDPEDPDSEEEVDHSWRLDLSMERIRHLENATPKEKLLWMMWNKFAHENYPIPSLYAERYTRFTLELFALEYGKQVAFYKLRVQFVGFLRALHIHGLIDTTAILSIMKCLDGKKKRRDLGVSTRPEMARDPNTTGASSRGVSRPRKGRRRNGRSRLGSD
ncbi:unnamed protein product [Chondrus crispus]|uniref:Uncharacterized protein n=1 Tax=Chondrus crispus TaxID=2769 RepID=R7QS39_CHOCR|nr:unnamed protein product [Chondrus crispus]CDF40934.1 unnamed protein product [Chondrus crispus]|eukprot:XP_005711228.1 unnamed protein product [Chondrus crispus]